MKSGLISLASILALGGITVGNMNLEPSVLDYPLLANEPIEKLEWVYRAEEVLRLEHNEKGRQFREGQITEAQWNEYLAKEFNEASKALGYEKAVLREELGYSLFKATTTKQEIDRQIQEKERFKNSDRFDVKTDEIFVDNIADAATEDFTTYTEVDAASKITVTAPKVEWTAWDYTSDGRVYKDMGAAHFSGNFEHLWEAYLDAATTDGDGGNTWSLANVTNLTIVSSADSLRVRMQDEGNARFTLWEYNGGSAYSDLDALSLSTLYYIKTERDESVGTFGTLYNYIYSDSGRTTLVATQTLVLHATVDFQYQYALSSRGAPGGNPITGYVQNLDIQEASAPSEPTVYHVMNMSGDLTIQGDVILKPN